MALPADRLANVLSQDLNDKLIKDLESYAKKVNHKVYFTYPYTAEDGAVAGTIALDPYGSTTSNNRRKLRILGCLLNVNWTTDYNTTRAAIQTAVGTL